MKRMSMLASVPLVTLMMLLSGCGAGTEQTTDGTVDSSQKSEPVVLTLYNKLNYPQESLQKYMIESIRKKYPEITLNIVQPQSGVTDTSLITSGAFPDLIFLSNPNIQDLKKLEALEDLTDYAKKSNIDLNKFTPETLGAIKTYGGEKGLYALPFSTNYGVTYYNKDIFDKFGIPYPKDGMSWSDYVDISRKLTRNVDGIQYIGVDPYPLERGGPMSLDVVDSVTHKALFTAEGWGKAFRLMANFYDIPGNIHANNYRDLFIKEQTLATYMTYDYTQNMGTLNWDMATFPSLPESPGVGHAVDSHNLALSVTSKHKDIAFKVLQYLTTNQEVQLELTKNGKLPSILDPETQKHFGANVPALKNKNIDAIFKSKPAPVPKITELDRLVRPMVDIAYNKLTAGDRDINTMLREVNDAADKAIQQEKAK
ncbi:ABC transporter substrate-binding protein [Paenibacillus sp. UNC451MF]|uniref:ABC transporter substrate-binding protein n=1 Tax=Paenibacillus sp. UNC451MF TaxID=1449063 RepID=UPI00048D456B|nr:extracellular solute-binding protein [Paenibacillus sp. UNC451MF]